jgi:predicted Zn-dependent protease
MLSAGAPEDLLQPYLRTHLRPCLRPRSLGSRLTSAVLVAAWLVGCASPAAIRPIPEIGSGFALEPDEVKIWEQARREERELLKKVKLAEDPLLNDYVDALGQSLVDPAARRSGNVSFRFRVIEDPTLNAFAFPHGSVYVHSGLVARTGSEAQLALVLGHEIAHVEKRHAVRHQRSANRKALGFGVAAAAASILIAHEAGQKAEKGDYSSAAVISRTADIILGVGLQLAFVAAIQGYGRELERESDEAGMAKMVGGGFDPSQGPGLFALLLKERQDPGKMERFFFSSHPANEERKRTADELVQTRYAAQAGKGKVTSPDFERRRRLVLRQDARLNMAAGRLDLAAEEIGQVLAAVPSDPVALALRGDLRMQRAAGAAEAERRRAEDEAMRDYEAAISADDTYAPPHREAGLILFKRGERAKARRHLERYLALAPGAEDARVIRDYLSELK